MEVRLHDEHGVGSDGQVQACISKNVLANLFVKDCVACIGSCCTGAAGGLLEEGVDG